jgi:hypothetical protein
VNLVRELGAESAVSKSCSPEAKVRERDNQSDNIVAELEIVLYYENKKKQRERTWQ